MRCIDRSVDPELRYGTSARFRGVQEIWDDTASFLRPRSAGTAGTAVRRYSGTAQAVVSGSRFPVSTSRAGGQAIIAQGVCCSLLVSRDDPAHLTQSFRPLQVVPSARSSISFRSRASPTSQLSAVWASITLKGCSLPTRGPGLRNPTDVRPAVTPRAMHAICEI